VEEVEGLGVIGNRDDIKNAILVENTVEMPLGIGEEEEAVGGIPHNIKVVIGWVQAGQGPTPH